MFFVHRLVRMKLFSGLSQINLGTPRRGERALEWFL